MTVATSSSSSPNNGNLIIAPPTLAPTLKSGDDVDNNTDNAKDVSSHEQTSSQHPVTERQSRQLVDLLLEEGERRSLRELISGATVGEMEAINCNFYTTTTSGNSSSIFRLSALRPGEPDDEAVCGWERSPSLVVRKSTVPRSNGTGAGGVGAARKRASSLRSGFSSSSVPDGTESSATHHGGVIRCISEDYVPGAHSHRKAAWKSNVEPGTYRYIVNNGIYRSTKFASLGGDWVTAKRSRGGTGAAAAAAAATDTQVQGNQSQYRASLSSSLSSASGPKTSDVRQRQSMIRRDLNRYSFLSNGATDAATARRLQFEHSTIKAGDQLGEMSPSPAGVNHRDLAQKAEHESPYQQQQRNDKNQQNQPEQQQLQPPLPPWSSSSCYSRPDTRDPQLVKSASDLFVEKFSSKIDALEKDDPTTAGTPDCLPRPGTNPAVAMTSLQSSAVAASSRRAGHKQNPHPLQTHDLGGNNPPPMSSSSSLSDKSSAFPQADDISRDVFTVKPAVGIRASDQMPLKPLEKLTPQMQSKARKGKLKETGETSDTGGESRSETTSSASQSHTIQMALHSGASNCSTPLGGAVSPPNLPASFMTAMNAFSQIHHHYHLADPAEKKKSLSSKQQSKSSPPTFRSSQSNNGGDKNSNRTKTNPRNGFNAANKGGSKYTQFHAQSDTDSLSSVKNALTLTNNDIEKMRMNHLAVRDYNRYISTRPKTQLTGLAAKPPAGNKKGANSTATQNHSILASAKTLGLRPFNTTSAPLVSKHTAPSLPPPSDDLSGVMSDSDTDSFLAGTSLLTARGARERGMSLPEISGKRLSVTTSSQRML
ncbi:hypothetical protein PoB_000576500 [Plakobranchus ocellatus]|uniref:Uncharacterized protein n=1 Tax=Plakobranchus ocellatus TaxID=259542 RepID=A0AAV3Y8Y1_9GAST|nr:hypothetical protein PoB_000576500 [Plakobranchus ocellatus]